MIRGRERTGQPRGRTVIITYLTRSDKWFISGWNLRHPEALVIDADATTTRQLKAGFVKTTKFMLAARDEERKAGGKRTPK